MSSGTASLQPDAAAEGERNDPLESLIEHTRGLVDDLELSVVREWKDAHPHPGALAIGYMPVYVPRPFLEALGCLPVAVFGGGDKIDIIRGDSYFQSYICHIPRSTLELGLGGQLDVLDGMIFPSTCDVIRNLGGMWRLLFPERYVSYLDLPQNFDLELGGRFYARELQRIAGELAARGARPLDPENLRQALTEEAQRLAVLAEVDELRREEPWRLRATEAYLLARAGTLLPVRTHTQLVRDFLAAALERPVQMTDNARVVLVGSFCEQPPLELIRTLERAGCDIVEDDFQLGLRTLEPVQVDAGDDPLEALVRAYLEHGAPSACRYIDDGIKGETLIQRVKACRADGVIFAAASFCDPALLDQPMMEAALDKAGVPHSSFKFSENTGQFHTIREQAGAFSDSVRLWATA